MLDTLIQNALIVDGSGEKPYKGTVGILNGKIATITREQTLPKTLEAKHIIDAHGHVVCPGFIDMHSHSDLQIFSDRKLQ